MYHTLQRIVGDMSTRLVTSPQAGRHMFAARRGDETVMHALDSPLPQVRNAGTKLATDDFDSGAPEADN